MPGDRFYQSSTWKNLRLQALKRDHFRCVICGVYVGGKGDGRVDHIKTRRDRPDLALDLANLRSLCALHDNQAHREKGGGGGARIERFSGCDADGWPLDPARRETSRKDERSAPHPDWIGRSLVPVNLVCGPPNAGKTTLVQKLAAPEELIINLDWIISEFSGIHDFRGYERLDRREWLDAALQRRNEMLDSLSRPSEWTKAWLIVGEPKAAHRAWWRNKLGPGTNYLLLAPIEVCYARIAKVDNRSSVQEEHRAVIRYWWNNYKPELNDVLLPPVNF